METVQKVQVTPNPPGQRLLEQGPSRSSSLCPQPAGRELAGPPGSIPVVLWDALQGLCLDPAWLTAMDAGTKPEVRGLDLHTWAFTYEMLPAPISCVSTSLGR